MRHMPVPNTVNPEMQAMIGAAPFPFWNLHPKSKAEWKAFAQKVAEAGEAALPKLREQMEVTVVPGTIAGVPVFTITPRNPRPENAERILLHFHRFLFLLFSSCFWINIS